MSYTLSNLFFSFATEHTGDWPKSREHLMEAAHSPTGCTPNDFHLCLNYMKFRRPALLITSISTSFFHFPLILKKERGQNARIYSDTCTHTAEQSKGDAAETKRLATRQRSHVMARNVISSANSGELQISGCWHRAPGRWCRSM